MTGINVKYKIFGDQKSLYIGKDEARSQKLIEHNRANKITALAGKT